MQLARILASRYIVFGAFATIISIALLWHTDFGLIRYGDQQQKGICSLLQSEDRALEAVVAIPPKRRRVAIASRFAFHFDVYMALAWTLERVMNRSEVGGSVEVYAELPFFFDFGTIVQELNLYSGEPRNPADLIRSLESKTAEGAIDMIILGTCESDLRGDQWHQALLSAWDKRDDQHKFKLVCIVHNIQDTAWQPSITEWSRRDAIRILTISEHVAMSFQESFSITADNIDPSMRLAGYENIPVDVHVPILDIPDLPKQSSSSRILSNAVIQGSFSIDRRDYTHIFNELIASLNDDPHVWGYIPRGDQPSFIVNPDMTDPPFHLFIIGSGWLDVPIELTNIVSVHTNMNYTEFYALMSRMDLCLPAFAENGYFHMQASSTFAMALQCNVPILVTKRMRKSYAYADDDRAVVTRPAAMREIAALRALRLGNATSFLNSDTLLTSKTVGISDATRHAVEVMMRSGWKRKKSDFQVFKANVWGANDIVVERLIRDL